VTGAFVWSARLTLPLTSSPLRTSELDAPACVGRRSTCLSHYHEDPSGSRRSAGPRKLSYPAYNSSRRDSMTAPEGHANEPPRNGVTPQQCNLEDRYDASAHRGSAGLSMPSNKCGSARESARDAGGASHLRASYNPPRS